MEFKLKPVESQTLVEQVEGQLMEYLMATHVRVGDLLPKETELAETFGVSRTVVREALTRLRVRGLIESVKHKGSVVTYPDVMANLEQVLRPRILDTATLKEFYEMRLVLEVGMADLVFARLKDEDLAELDEIVSEEPQSRSDTIFATEYEIRFHGKLYQIAGNKTLARFQSLLLPVFGYVHESGLHGEFTPGRPWVSHRGLVDILRTGTPEKFRQAMRLHLDSHFQRICGGRI